MILISHPHFLVAAFTDIYGTDTSAGMTEQKEFTGNTGAIKRLFLVFI